MQVLVYRPTVVRLVSFDVLRDERRNRYPII
jgi:hypothetical protein